MRNILLVFFFFLIIHSDRLFAQQFGIKAGLGFPTIYQTDEVNYYRNKLDHKSNPSFIFSLRLNWHLAGNLYIAWEPGVIEKSGKITGIARGFDSQDNDIYGFDGFNLWNLENSVILDYTLFTIKDIMMNIYIGPGISWNISDKPTFDAKIARGYDDYPYQDYENPYFNNTGLYLNIGVNLEYANLQFDLRYIKEYTNLRVDGFGRYKSYLFCFLIGYKI